jgi:hypothetical protein
MDYFINEINENGFYYTEYVHGENRDSMKDRFLNGQLGLNNFVWHVLRSTREHIETSWKECFEWVQSLKTNNKQEEKIMENENTGRLMDEFEALCKPLNEWLQKNYHPHAKIIIETDNAEVVEGSMAVPFEVFD